MADVDGLVGLLVAIAAADRPVVTASLDATPLLATGRSACGDEFCIATNQARTSRVAELRHRLTAVHLGQQIDDTDHEPMAVLDNRGTQAALVRFDQSPGLRP